MIKDGQPSFWNRLQILKSAWMTPCAAETLLFGKLKERHTHVHVKTRAPQKWCFRLAGLLTTSHGTRNGGRGAQLQGVPRKPIKALGLSCRANYRPWRSLAPFKAKAIPEAGASDHLQSQQAQHGRHLKARKKPTGVLSADSPDPLVDCFGANRQVGGPHHLQEKQVVQIPRCWPLGCRLSTTEIRNRAALDF